MPPSSQTRPFTVTGKAFKPAKVVPLLRPGSFVRLDNQPSDLPPFQVLHCRGGRCWVRQQSWGSHVQWEVEHERLKVA